MLNEYLAYLQTGRRPDELSQTKDHGPYKRSPAALDIELIINQSGPIPYSRFMEQSLAGPYGYYSAGLARISEEGAHDFSTHPELYPGFAPTMAMIASRVWESMGSPRNFPLVEMGAGRGTLAAKTLDWIKKNHKDFYNRIQYSIVDLPGMAAKQRKILQQHTGKVRWYEGSALDLPSQVRGVDGMFISNELPDALPMEIVKQDGVHIVQKYIGVENGRFVELWNQASPEVLRYLHEFSIDVDEKEMVVNLNAVRFQHQVSSALRRGLILTIDYGDDYANSEETIGSVRTYYNNNGKQSPGPLAYELPGEVDITANIDFGPLMKVAKAYGGSPILFDQPSFFGSHEVPMSVSDADRLEIARSYKFKVLAVRKNIPNMRFNGGLVQEFNLRIPPRRDISAFSFRTPPSDDDAEFLRGIKDSCLDDLFERGNWEMISFPTGYDKHNTRLEDFRGKAIVQYDPFEVLYDFRKKADLQRLLQDSGISGIDIDAFINGQPFL